MKTVWRIKKDGQYLRIDKNGRYSFCDTTDNRIACFNWRNAIQIRNEYGGTVEKGIG